MVASIDGEPASPSIVEAVKLLAHADQQDVAYAMVGLRSRPLVEAAQAAARQLQLAAERLAVVAACDRIAVEMSAEMTALRTASGAHMQAPLPVADWGELITDLVPAVLRPLGVLMLHDRADVSADTRSSRAAPYMASAKLSQVNHSWARAVREWRRGQQCIMLLLRDAAYLALSDALRMVARDSPLVRELFLQPQSILPIDDGDLQTLRTCRALQQLSMPRSDGLSTAALVEFLTDDQLPQLTEVDVSGIYLGYGDGEVDKVFGALALRPTLRLRVGPLDPLWTSSEGKPSRAQLLRVDDDEDGGIDARVNVSYSAT